MKNLLKYLLAAALLPAWFVAGAQETGNAAMPFLDYTMSPRQAAMGGASAALDADAFAQFGNVAASAFASDSYQVGVSYYGWQPSMTDSKSGLVGASLLFGRFGVTVGGSAGFNAPYTVAGEGGYTVGQFSPKDWRFGAGLSYRISDSFSAGVGLNWANSTLSPYGDAFNTFFASVQLMYRVKGFRLALSGNNLGLPVTSASGEKFALPMNAELSAAYVLELEKHSVSALLDGRAYFGGPFALSGSVGAEYEYGKLIAVRAGYHAGSDKSSIPSFASVGLGVRFYGVKLEGAYLIAGKDSPIKNTFTAGLSYAF